MYSETQDCICEKVDNGQCYVVQMVATICMFIAGKVEETPRSLRDVILMSYENCFKKDRAAVHRIKQKVTYLYTNMAFVYIANC
jgi:hypothetical protein